MTAAIMSACGVALIPAGIRWLRVAQREHYLAGSMTRFAIRWWSKPINRPLIVVGLAGVVASIWLEAGALAAAAAAAVGPVGLSVRGRTSPLVWTWRLRRMVGGVILVSGLVLGVGWLAGVAVPVAAAGTLFIPFLADVALLAFAPLEYRLSRPWVDRARRRLRESSPTVIGVTGSFGKTTTKHYIADLLASKYAVVASPASFNNEMGLSRAINENLVSGTEVFVAEMGSYGPGEIAAMVSWLKPTISVITAIGPVHLERFESLDQTVAAKAEILDGAEVGILGVDSPELLELADQVSAGQHTIRCSTQDPDADIFVSSTDVRAAGRRIASLAEPLAYPSNVACAVAVARELGVGDDAIAARLGSLTVPDHRLQIAAGSSGVTIVDDTYNSNPAGATLALQALVSRSTGGRRVVVTPGMVELGPQQTAANREFARQASAVASEIIVVGFTNREALVQGADEGSAAVMLMPSRDEAVAWVRSNLGADDIVLYENDLPDHYP